MPVRRFRSIEDMKRGGTWRERDDPELERAIAALWDTGSRTSRLAVPPGVHKFKSLDEMVAAQGAAAVKKSGPGDLKKLLFSGDLWTVGGGDAE